MLVIRFRVHVQPEKIDEAVEAFRAVVPPSRELDGVISFDIARDILDPNCIVTTEVFADEAARERQEAQPEVARVMTLLPDVLAAPPEATVFTVASAADALAAS
jgi:quinol monooxygenase YgiN